MKGGALELRAPEMAGETFLMDSKEGDELSSCFNGTGKRKLPVLAGKRRIARMRMAHISAKGRWEIELGRPAPISPAVSRPRASSGSILRKCSHSDS